MSYHVLFSFSTGLAATIYAPKGQLAVIRNHLAELENTLGLERERPYAPEGQEPKGWKWKNLGERLEKFEGSNKYKADEELCALLEVHNRYIVRLYDSFGEWSKNKKGKDFEPITPEEAQEWWHMLRTIEPPQDRWSRHYYKAEMEAIYEALRGRDNDRKWTYDEPPLTERQAAGVINILAGYLDNHDLRLDVPHDLDELRSSYDGGYSWCNQCGPVAEEYLDEARAGQCGRASRKKCELHQESLAEEKRERRYEAEKHARQIANTVQDSRKPGETRGKATLQTVLDALGYPAKNWRRREAQLKTWRALELAVKMGYLTRTDTTPPVYERTTKSTGRTSRL